MPTMERTVATKSQRPGCGSRDSGRMTAPATNATAISGTLTRNAACQLKCSSSAPPTIGPTAAPMADTAAHTPSAVARSSASVKTDRISESVVGMIMAPPTPSSARVAITCSGDSAARISADAAPKTRNPASRIRLRPHRSASALIGISRPASTRL